MNMKNSCLNLALLLFPLASCQQVVAGDPIVTEVDATVEVWAGNGAQGSSSKSSAGKYKTVTGPLGTVSASFVASGTSVRAHVNTTPDDAVATGIVFGFASIDGPVSEGPYSYYYTTSGEILPTLQIGGNTVSGSGHGTQDSLSGIFLSIPAHSSADWTMVASWNAIDDRPGRDKDNTKKFEQDEDRVYVPDGKGGDATAEEGPEIANDTTGAYLVDIAVVQENGFTEPIFLEVEDTGSEPTSLGASPEYVWFVDGPNFSTFEIPDDLPLGDDTFEIEFDGMAHTLTAGATFDFTQFVSGGVQWFFLKGIDPSENLIPLEAFPFVTAHTFVAEGAATVITGVVAPEVTGDFNGDGSVDNEDLADFEAAFGATDSGDGDGDGDTDGADFLIWQRLFGINVSESVASVAIPEPTSGSLLCLVAVTIFFWCPCGDLRSRKKGRSRPWVSRCTVRLR